MGLVWPCTLCALCNAVFCAYASLFGSVNSLAIVKWQAGLLSLAMYVWWGCFGRTLGSWMRHDGESCELTRVGRHFLGTAATNKVEVHGYCLVPGWMIIITYVPLN